MQSFFKENNIPDARIRADNKQRSTFITTILSLAANFILIK
ncbi:hypothetical protein RU98_GL002713 [Enterococcus caccae]|nr:hypothetical protein RU98_GL002713 [Enterococcus caccae]